MKEAKNNSTYQVVNKVLVANRGEIAVRIIRACQELGIKAIAVYSQPEKDELHVQNADEAICIGPGPILKSYMHIPSLIQAAVSLKVDAIHPGYGMLSENYEFAKQVSKAGLLWIGPKWEVIKALGNKSQAKTMASKLGIPAIPGYEKVKSALDASIKAKAIGYPVIIKAANAGGGRCMQVVNSSKEIIQAYKNVLNNTKLLYNDNHLLLEKYITNVNHVEIQILADNHGIVRHLYERDCTLQRRKQKLIEETPSPFITPKTRQALANAAVKLAKHCGYTYAGTVEFLVDQNQNFYFLEMNTRIQVEHPITEEVTGIDIVKEQLKIAGGKKLNFKQSDVNPQKHSIEVRINAENPKRDFAPSVGRISFLHAPSGKGIRWESALYSGLNLSPFADSNIAKVIATSYTRKGAILKMKRALEELVIDNVKTNIHFQHNLLLSDDFINSKHTTSFVEKTFIPNYLMKLAKGKESSNV